MRSVISILVPDRGHPRNTAYQRYNSERTQPWSGPHGAAFVADARRRSPASVRDSRYFISPGTACIHPLDKGAKLRQIFLCGRARFRPDQSRLPWRLAWPPERSPVQKPSSEFRLCLNSAARLEFSFLKELSGMDRAKPVHRVLRPLSP